jgi:hypothetical protein
MSSYCIDEDEAGMMLTGAQPYYMELIDEFFPQKVLKW